MIFFRRKRRQDLQFGENLQLWSSVVPKMMGEAAEVNAEAPVRPRALSEVGINHQSQGNHNQLEIRVSLGMREHPHANRSKKQRRKDRGCGNIQRIQKSSLFQTVQIISLSPLSGETGIWLPRERDLRRGFLVISPAISKAYRDEKKERSPISPRWQSPREHIRKSQWSRMWRHRADEDSSGSGPGSKREKWKLKSNRWFQSKEKENQT